MAVVACPTCRAGLQLPANVTARAVRCPKCKGVVPLASKATAPAPQEAPKAPPADAITVTCPSCAKALRARAELAGRTIRCPGCQSPVKVPGAAPAAAGPSGPPKPAERSARREAPAPEPEDTDEPEERDDEDDRPVKRRSRPAQGADGPPVRPVAPGDDPFEGLGVPEDMQEKIRDELEDGEEIVWVGRPVPAILMKKMRIAFLLGLVLGPLALAGLVAGVVIGGKVALSLGLGVGGFLTLFSALLLIAPTLTRRSLPRRACYVVTPRRAIVYQGGLLGAQSYDRRQLMTRLDRKDSTFMEGAGSLIFDVQVEYDVSGSGRGAGRSGGASVHERKTEHGFLDVARVAEVEKLLRDVLIKRQAGGPEEPRPAPAEKRPAAPPAKRREGEAHPDDDRGEPADAEELVEASGLPDKLKDNILRRLNDDERAVWVGRPHPHLVFLRGLGTAATLIGISVVASVIILTTGSLREWYAFVFLGAVFVGGVLTPFYRRWKAGNTAYVLTTRRCLVFEPNHFGTIEVATYLPDIVSRMRRENAWLHKGGGDLIFRTKTVVTTKTTTNRRTGMSSSSSTVSVTHYGFLALEDVAAVERLVNRHLVEPYLDRVHGV